MTAATNEFLDTLEARVRWLEGKLTEFSEAHRKIVLQENNMVATYGQPTSVEGRTIYRVFWGTFYAEAVAFLAPYASELRSAIRRLQELGPRIRAVTTATADQASRLGRLRTRGNTALRRSRLVASVYRDSAVGRNDPNVTSFWEYLIREAAAAFPTPVLEPSAMRYYREAVAAWERYEASLANPLTRNLTWWDRLTLRDKLAIVGLGTIVIGGIAVYGRIARAIP